VGEARQGGEHHRAAAVDMEEDALGWRRPPRRWICASPHGSTTGRAELHGSTTRRPLSVTWRTREPGGRKGEGGEEGGKGRRCGLPASAPHRRRRQGGERHHAAGSASLPHGSTTGSPVLHGSTTGDPRALWIHHGQGHHGEEPPPPSTCRKRRREHRVGAGEGVKSERGRKGGVPSQRRAWRARSGGAASCSVRRRA
jgi:hypothetical protein